MTAPAARNRLVVRQEDPFNAETPLEPDSPAITPVADFYVRSHFPLPEPAVRIGIGGAVHHPFDLTVDDLLSLPTLTLVATMECAGNGRAFLSPPIGGVPWGLGAVATASWTGVPLTKLLDQASVRSEAIEIVFSGRDYGIPSRSDRSCSYERSLSVGDPILAECLVAHTINGDPLTPDHGGPVRLIVPGWYGMASVKWLDRIAAVTEPFDGFYQVDDYVMRGKDRSLPCREMAVRALIINPRVESVLPLGEPVVVSGYAWSGMGAIGRVEVSTDDGQTWSDATVDSGPPNVWRSWRTEWVPDAVGRHSILARASDASGNVQPLEQVWNEGGYGNNRAVPTVVMVRR